MRPKTHPTEMNCEHVWVDASANRISEWACSRCKVTYTQVKPSTSTKRSWDGLRDKEISDILEDVRKQTGGNVYLTFARAIENELRAKNA